MFAKDSNCTGDERADADADERGSAKPGDIPMPTPSSLALPLSLMWGTKRRMLDMLDCDPALEWLFWLGLLATEPSVPPAGSGSAAVPACRCIMLV
jgi:hypothetical protein